MYDKLTREVAIEIAKDLHKARCKAFWNFWQNGGEEPKDKTYGYHHGWIAVGKFRIRADEYAPGPTYNVD